MRCIAMDTKGKIKIKINNIDDYDMIWALKNGGGESAKGTNKRSFWAGLGPNSEIDDTRFDQFFPCFSTKEVLERCYAFECTIIEEFSVH